MTIAVDYDVKHLFKQKNNKVRFNELAHYAINIFVFPHVNNDLYMEQMNHSVVIKLKINNFMLTFTGISPCLNV